MVRRGIYRVAALATTLAGIVAFTAGSANAVSEGSESADVEILSSCPSNGIIGPYSRCTSLSNGVLFHLRIFNGSTFDTRVTTTYEKTGGSIVTVRLGFSEPYYGVGAQWGSNHRMVSGDRRSYEKSWPIGTNKQMRCRATVGMMQDPNGTNWQTPATASC